MGLNGSSPNAYLIELAMPSPAGLAPFSPEPTFDGLPKSWVFTLGVSQNFLPQILSSASIIIVIRQEIAALRKSSRAGKEYSWPACPQSLIHAHSSDARHFVCPGIIRK